MNAESDPLASKSVAQQEFLIATRRYRVSSRMTLVLLFSYDEEKAVAVFRANDPRFSLQQEHMEGEHGAVLKIFDKSVGQGLLSMNLQSMPVFDGMILAGGKVLMSTVDGTVLCFAVEP